MDISYSKNSATLEDVKKQFEDEKDKEKQAKRARWKKSHPYTPKKSDDELIKILSERI